MTCAFTSPLVTARARCDHQVTGAVRTQRGPADLVLISALHPSLFSAGSRRRPARTTYRWTPLGSDALWTNLDRPDRCAPFAAYPPTEPASPRQLQEQSTNWGPPYRCPQLALQAVRAKRPCR
jgi:hypothetical protein